MREAIRRDDFITMPRSRPSPDSGPSPPAPPSLEHFEYCRISDEWGVLRLLARVHDELGVPSDPLLLVTPGALPPDLVAPRTIATERQLGSPTLAWHGEFAVPTELVERFDAAFALHDGPVRWLDLPTPALRVGAVGPESLLVARLPRAVRPATRRRQRAAALAVSAAALGTAATPAAAAAATGTTTATGSVTATRAGVAVTTTTSVAAPAGMATASSATHATADGSATRGTAGASATHAATGDSAMHAPGATRARSATGADTTTATTTAPRRAATTTRTGDATAVTAPAATSGDPVATDASGATTTTRVATATKTTTATATHSATASTTGTARQRASATTPAATLTSDPRASATRRCAPPATATLAGTSGRAEGVAASSLASPASSRSAGSPASSAGRPSTAPGADAVCATDPSPSPQRKGEHADAHRPGRGDASGGDRGRSPGATHARADGHAPADGHTGATPPRRAGVAAVWLSPSTPAGHAAAQRRRTERAAAQARATAHAAAAIQLAAGLAAAARRAERAQQAHEAYARQTAESTPGSSSTTTAGGGQTSTSTPGYSGPTSWTGTVAADPGLTGVVRNLAGLLTDGNRPPSFLIPIYIAAGRRYHVPWQVLAAINAVETDYGRDLNTSSAGAVGWMQFMPGTWREYGVAVDGASVPNPYDPRDAIFAAARYLAANGARGDLRGAIYAYNHADWYVAEVLSRAQAIASEPQYEQASVTRRGSVSVRFTVDRPRPARITYGSGFLSHFDRLIAAANMVSAADFPYRWGGGHEQPARFGPFDCSGSVSYVMQQAGYELATSVSGQIGGWGLPHGPGRVTIFYNAVHTFMRIGNRYFGTSGFARPGGGAGWFDVDRLPAGYLAAFHEVHVPDLGADSFAADPQLTFRARPGLLRARARLATLSALRAFGHERLSALAIHRALAHPLHKRVSLPPR